MWDREGQIYTMCVYYVMCVCAMCKGKFIIIMCKICVTMCCVCVCFNVGGVSVRGVMCDV